jgi:hypothetical protein
MPFRTGVDANAVPVRDLERIADYRPRAGAALDQQLLRGDSLLVPRADRLSGTALVGAGRRVAPSVLHLSGGGVKVCPSAVESDTKIRVAGAEQTRVRGSSARVGETGQSPDAMSLLARTVTVVSVVVS